MADDEQFSLCWNNFNSNLSAGFHESLCRGDLVDVTLAAEGQFVKAHRLVLSVCSPYFRKMFTQMPANQHAFVFLKDVSHTALKDLIQFMYCGEVNVKQEALPAFISTAEALQIKGLTDSDPPQSQTPPEPSTPTPQIQTQQIQASPRVRHRTSTGRSYKIETVDDSGDDTKQTTQIVIQTTAPSHPPQATITQASHHHQQSQHQPSQQHITQQPIQTQTHQLTSVSLPTSTATTAVVTHKRPAQRTNLGSVPHIKRSKSTIDPLEASDATVATQQLNVQTTVVTSDVTKSQAQQQQHHHHQQHHQQQQQQTQSHHHQNQPQQTNEPEYIDLPIELPTKSEPDYVEDAGEVDQGEQDGTYVEDESYGDMRYDESYFTEGEDAAASAGNAATGGGATNTSATATTSKAIVKSQPLSDSSYMDTTGDQGNSDAQAKPPKSSQSNTSAAGSSEEFRKPQNLPKILDGKFYNNIQPHPKTPGGIQATCTTCSGIISGTTKSTGNFLSHIKRRHKDILPSCQLYCSSKSLSCFNQVDMKFPPFPGGMTSPPTPILLHYAANMKDVKTETVPTSTTIAAMSTFVRSGTNTSSSGQSPS
ncbi:modifier of mdg4-like isoform X3 [Haematobia irritans]|uniref:modifier of mdg4-like isoform X3 n=1 Tax=Haematobia irritans TaxID=7368 RepID=UPI003F4F8A52